MFLARQRSIKHVWAYMLLGQVVAISVASNLFYLAALLSPLPSSKRGAPQLVPIVLWLSIVLSLGTVFLIPHSLEHGYFLSNLLTMHILLVIPLAAPPSLLSSKFMQIRLRTLYAVLAVVTLIPRSRTISLMLESTPVEAEPRYEAIARGLWQTLHSHPAQSSIGWDVVWTTVSFLAWISTTPSATVMLLPLSLGSVAFSVGLMAPVALWVASSS